MSSMRMSVGFGMCGVPLSRKRLSFLAKLGALRDGPEIDNRRPVAGFLDEIADQLDGLEFRVGDIQTRWMAEEVEHRPVLDGPLDTELDRLEKPIQLPAAGAEGADVTNRAHRHFDQASRIDEWLGLLLSLNDAIVNVLSGLLAGSAYVVGGVLAAYPVEAEVAQHLLHIGGVFQPVREPTRRAEPGWVDADSRLEGHIGQLDVLDNHILRPLSMNQPR